MRCTLKKTMICEHVLFHDFLLLHWNKGHVLFPMLQGWPAHTLCNRRFGAAEHEDDEGPKTASPALQNMRLGPDSSHCVRAANPDNQWDAIGFLVQPRAKFHVTQISRFRAQEFWKKIVAEVLPKCWTLSYPFKSQSSKNQSPKTLFLISPSIFWRGHGTSFMSLPWGTNVLISPVSRMFQSNQMCPPWHILSAYSKNVILQEVT